MADCLPDIIGVVWVFLYLLSDDCSATKSPSAIRISRLTSCLKNLYVLHAKGSFVLFASLCHLSLIFISPRMLSVTQGFCFPRILKDLTGACCSSISLKNVSKAKSLSSTLSIISTMGQDTNDISFSYGVPWGTLQYIFFFKLSRDNFNLSRDNWSFYRVIISQFIAR